jgi:hypothetical protein
MVDFDIKAFFERAYDVRRKVCVKKDIVGEARVTPGILCIQQHSL